MFEFFKLRKSILICIKTRNEIPREYNKLEPKHSKRDQIALPQNVLMFSLNVHLSAL